MIFIAQQDPWQPYHPGKGKGKGHPVVPEFGVYGAMLLVLMAGVAWMRRKR